MRTAFEVIEGKHAVLGQRNVVKLNLIRGKLSANSIIDGKEHGLFEKNVYKSDEPVFISATSDSDYFYIKAANTGNMPHMLEIPLEGKHKAELTLLTGGKNDVNALESGEIVQPRLTTFNFFDILKYEIPPYSVTVLKINIG